MKATTRFGNEVATVDEGFDGDPLFVYCDSMGPMAIIRATSWHEAWEICEDIVLPDADPEDPNIYATSYDDDAEPVELAEGVGYRPNGAPAEGGPFPRSSHLYAEDLNGSTLDRTTPEDLQERFRITLTLDEEAVR